jgi:hypothetical protein
VVVVEAELVAAADRITVGFTTVAVVRALPANNMVIASVNVRRTKFFCSYESFKIIPYIRLELEATVD